MNKKILACIFLLIPITLSGCATRIGDATILTNKNISLNELDLDSLHPVRGVTGTDPHFVFLFIPFGYPQIQDALDDALEKGGGDLMIDAVVHRTHWWFIVGQNSLEVKGTVVRTRNNQVREDNNE